MQSLTCCAVAVFGGQGLVPAKLVLHFSTVTLSLPFDLEIFRFLVHAVWFSVFPLIDISICGVTSLVLMSLLLLSHF